MVFKGTFKHFLKKILVASKILYQILVPKKRNFTYLDYDEFYSHLIS